MKFFVNKAEYQELPTMQWLIVPPKSYLIQNVLCTIERFDGTRYVEFGYVGSEKEMTRKNAIAYMIIPHINNEKRCWKSEYMGDNLPKVNGQYIACFECKASHDPQLNIRKCQFDKRNSKFGGVEAIGYMGIPKPYKGKKKLSFYKESDENEQ